MKKQREGHLVKNKAEYRKFVQEMRENIQCENKLIMDKKIYDNFINSELYKLASNIFIYVSYNSEVNTHQIINQALIDDKRIFVPKVISKKDGMVAVEIFSLLELSKGYFGVLEPTNFDKKIEENEIDLVLMPGVAFDKSGGRIGYGGGFYDRFLPKLNRDIKKIALAYSFQVFDYVPHELHDEKIDGIITDEYINTNI